MIQSLRGRLHIDPHAARRVIALTLIFSLLAIDIALWVGVIRDPVQYTGTDFRAFYAAGKITQATGYEAAYRLDLQKSAEEDLTGLSIPQEDVNPFVHPPFILPLLNLLGRLPYLTAFSAWAFIMILLFLVSACLLVAAVPSLGPRHQLVLLAGTLLFFPSFFSILNGQDTALLLLGCSAAFYGLISDDDRLAGLGLALTTIRPHIALLLALPFLFNRRRVWWWFCAGAAALAFFSIALIGLQGTRSFISTLAISASGEGYRINEAAMFNTIGLLRRIVPAVTGQPIRVAGWAVYVCALLALVIVWVRTKTIRAEHFAMAVIVSLLAAPHLHYHDLAILLVPLFCAIRFLLEQGLGKAEDVLLLPLVLSLIMLLSLSVPLLYFLVPYLAMIALFLALLLPGRLRVRA